MLKIKEHFLNDFLPKECFSTTLVKIIKEERSIIKTLQPNEYIIMQHHN